MDSKYNNQPWKNKLLDKMRDFYSGLAPFENKKNYNRVNFRTGFTLVEVMVATAILSFGLVMVLQSFFISLDTFDYYQNHLKVQTWMDEKIWQLHDDFRQLAYFEPATTKGEFTIGNKNFTWEVNYSTLHPEELYKLDLEVLWKQGARGVKLLRTTYAANYRDEES